MFIKWMLVYLLPSKAWICGSILFLYWDIDLQITKAPCNMHYVDTDVHVHILYLSDMEL